MDPHSNQPLFIWCKFTNIGEDLFEKDRWSIPENPLINQFLVRVSFVRSCGCPKFGPRTQEPLAVENKNLCAPVAGINPKADSLAPRAFFPILACHETVVMEPFSKPKPFPIPKPHVN